MSNYDDALERFQQIALEYAEGLANHGPMGAEALESLGHHAKIPAFVDVYAPRLPPIERGRVLTPDEQAAALGDFARAPDWVQTFETRIESEGVETVLRDALPTLLPGLFAAAGHGFLRVAHGLRALGRQDDTARRREVALGLAYWSARFQRLPGTPGAHAGAASLEEGLAAWPVLGEQADRKGLFFEVAKQLDAHAVFTEAVEAALLPEADAVDAWLSTLCRESARLYVAHPTARIAYVHAVTIPSALRALLPFLAPEEGVAAAGYALQAVGALHTLFGDPDSGPEDDDEVLRMAGDWDEVRYHAACSIEEHAIKMTEACWREDQRNPDPVLKRAGADAALKVGGRGQASVC